MTASATGEDFGWTGTSTFGASFSEGQAFYGSYSERAGEEDFASLDSNGGSVRVDGKIITFPGASADAQVDDSKADVSSFKLDLNAVPATVKDDDFVDSVVQDYLKFLASGASDSYGGTSGFWSDRMVALSFGLTPNGNSSARIRAGCSSDGSSSAVIRCEIFQAVFSNFAPNSGAADSGRDEPDSANNNDNYYNSNILNNNMIGLSYIAAPGTSAGSGFQLFTTANPCGCEALTPQLSVAPISTTPFSATPVSGAFAPESYDPGFSSSPSDAAATLLSTGSAVVTLPKAVDTTTWSGSPENYTHVVVPSGVSLTPYLPEQLGAPVPEIPTPAMILIGLAGIGFGLTQSRREKARREIVGPC